MDERIFLSANEAAAYFGVGRSAFYEHFLTPRRIPVVRIGKRILIHRDDLNHLAGELRAQAIEEAAERAQEIAAMTESSRRLGAVMSQYVADEGLTVASEALRAWDAGLCVMPARDDGTKAPDGLWNDYQERRPARDAVEGWFHVEGRTGLGIITGRVSGDIEAIDSDDHDA